MAKLSDKINLSGAVAKAKTATGSESEENVVDSLLNSGVKANKKRREKKEKSEPIAEENSLFAELIPQENKEEEPKEKWPKTYEEMCEYELRNAHEKNHPEPDFDFRTMFEKGQMKWFVRVLEPLGEKELLYIKIRTVYPRMLIATEEKTPICHCIGYNMRDQVFDTEYEAQSFFDTIKVSKKYSVDPIKIKSYEYEDEDSDMSVSEEDYNELMKEDE